MVFSWNDDYIDRLRIEDRKGMGQTKSLPSFQRTFFLRLKIPYKVVQAQ